MMQIVQRLQPQTSVHDLSPFRFLKGIAGISAYASRALVCPGTAVVGATNETDKKNLQCNHDWLRGIGMGADDMIVVENENLRNGILCDMQHRSYMQRVSDAIYRRSQPLSLFLSRDMEPLIMSLGLDWASVLSPHPQVSEIFDDKHYLRCLATNLGMSNAFPPWEYVNNGIDDLFRSCTRVLNFARDHLPTDTVFLKVHDYDGGEGVFRWEPNVDAAKLAAFAKQHLSMGIIVDAGYPRGKFRMHEFSVKVEINHSSWRPLYYSRQIVSHDAHMGNEVALGENILDRETDDAVYRTIAPLCKEAVRRGYGFGHTRTMGIDFMIVDTAKGRSVMLLEANARTTAVDYAMAVCQQAAERFGGHAAVVMENIDGLPPGIEHDQLRDHWLRGRPWNGKSQPGFLIGNAACLSRGKATVYCIGPTLAEARLVRLGLLPQPRETKRQQITDT